MNLTQWLKKTGYRFSKGNENMVAEDSNQAAIAVAAMLELCPQAVVIEPCEDFIVMYHGDEKFHAVVEIHGKKKTMIVHVRGRMSGAEMNIKTSITEENKLTEPLLANVHRNLMTEALHEVLGQILSGDVEVKVINLSDILKTEHVTKH